MLPIAESFGDSGTVSGEGLDGVRGGDVGDDRAGGSSLEFDDAKGPCPDLSLMEEIRERVLSSVTISPFVGIRESLASAGAAFLKKEDDLSFPLGAPNPGGGFIAQSSQMGFPSRAPNSFLFKGILQS